MEQVLVVGEVPALPLQRVGLCSVFCSVALCGTGWGRHCTARITSERLLSVKSGRLLLSVKSGRLLSVKSRLLLSVKSGR